VQRGRDDQHQRRAHEAEDEDAVRDRVVDRLHGGDVAAVVDVAEPEVDRRRVRIEEAREQAGRDQRERERKITRGCHMNFSGV
jgi:hypothetical protein